MKLARTLVITIIATFAAMGALVGQEAGVFTHYYLNPVMINPGATGFEDQRDIILNYRNKWAGFDGGPRTFTALYNGRIGERMGLGGQLLTERIGEFRTVYGAASYAYRFDVDNFEIGVGLSAGFQQIRLASVNDDPFLDRTDEFLNEALDGVLLLNGSLGFHGEYDDRLFFGFSMPNLIHSRLTSIANAIDDPNEEFNYALYFGYRVGVDDDRVKIEPSVAIRNIRRVPLHVDFNVKLSFLEEQLVGGLTYSVGDESRFGVLLGTRIENFRIYYSYDVSFGDFQQYSNGSHEITLQFTIPR